MGTGWSHALLYSWWRNVGFWSSMQVGYNVWLLKWMIGEVIISLLVSGREYVLCSRWRSSSAFKSRSVSGKSVQTWKSQEIMVTHRIVCLNSSRSSDVFQSSMLRKLLKHKLQFLKNPPVSIYSEIHSTSTQLVQVEPIVLSLFRTKNLFLCKISPWFNSGKII